MAATTKTFLELVTDVIVETGLNSGVAPLSVVDAEGDAAKVVYWVSVADTQIQRERIDWDFLWHQETVNLTQDSNIIPQPRFSFSSPEKVVVALINAVAKDRLAVIDSNGQSHFPQYMDWHEFAIIYNYETQPSSDFPSFWTMRPDGALMLSEPIASADMTCKYEFWQKPSRMTVNTSVSLIPDDYSRLIVLLAKVLYAEHEDAPEVDAGSNAHYEVVFNQMLAVHTPQSEWQRLENSDQYLTVDTR